MPLISGSRSSDHIAILVEERAYDLRYWHSRGFRFSFCLSCLWLAILTLAVSVSLFVPLQSVTDCEAKDMLRRRGMLPLACFVYFFAIYFKKLMTQPRTFLAQEEPFRAPGPCPVYFSGLELPVLGARTRRGRRGLEGRMENKQECRLQ